jgi:hypothetical protein
MWIADPRIVKLVYKEDKPVGFILAYPDIGAALRRIKGRLFPFGWLQVILESKRTNWANLNGIGIIPEYQRLGATAILFNELFESYKEIGRYDHIEFLQFREDNIKSLTEASNVDIDFIKTHRLYEKYL